MITIELAISGTAPAISLEDEAASAELVDAVEPAFAGLSVSAKRAVIAQLLVVLMRYEKNPGSDPRTAIPKILERVVNAAFAHGKLPMTAN